MQIFAKWHKKGDISSKQDSFTPQFKGGSCERTKTCVKFRDLCFAVAFSFLILCIRSRVFILNSINDNKGGILNS